MPVIAVTVLASLSRQDVPPSCWAALVVTVISLPYGVDVIFIDYRCEMVEVTKRKL